LFGAQYAMRVWLDPAKLDNFALTPSDVSAAILAQNVQVAACRRSRIGSSMQPSSGPSYPNTPEQFGNILLKAEPNHAKVPHEQLVSGPVVPAVPRRPAR
jgi:multidrug efflux pump